VAENFAAEDLDFHVTVRNLLMIYWSSTIFNGKLPIPSCFYHC